MKLFVWTDVVWVSNNYHNDGGIIVIAETLDRAREMLPTFEDGVCEAKTKEPDLIRECEGPEYIEVHPNAGCC